MNQKFIEQWEKLNTFAQNQSIKDIKSLFSDNSNRVKELTFEVDDIYVDFSKNWITKELLTELTKLAESADLQNKIKDLFAERIINISENKPATHIAQRKTNSTNKILSDRQTMLELARKYKSGDYLSAFGKKIETIVNIGIGGSYLGPKLAIEALSELQTNNDIKVMFYPSVDSVALKYILQETDITTSLFCISSKSLGTIETIKNTESIQNILQNTKGYKPTALNQSFVAATTNFQKAEILNIPKSHIMLLDPATGGRFSVWSSIGFPVLMAVGENKFLDFLNGAEKMDNHFESTKFQNNLPIIMALVSIWYRNFMKLPAYAIIPYDVRLKHLPAWLQQLMMESNGKMVGVNGEHLDHSTAPWIFGDHGQLSQHAFFQAFHQGKDVLPIDFIGVLEKDSNQNFLLVNMLAQSSALMSGNNEEKMCLCPGNRPSTTFLLNRLTANSLGQLLALYEHMVFVQSVIWNINCFDQPGVELGKKIANNIVNHMENNSLAKMELDKSTKKLLSRVIKK